MSALALIPARDLRRPSGLAGFTLMEVGLALVIFSLLLAVAIPSLNALTGADLRKAASQMQGLIRDTYARTALAGKSHRIVFDLEGDAFWVEETDGVARLNPEKQGTDAEGKGLLESIDDRLLGLEDSDDAEDQEKIRLWSPPTWTPVDDDSGKPTKLPPGVFLYAVWADHLDERVLGGMAALHFFPGGYTQEAHISMSDDEAGDNSLTVVTEPLTGETFIEREIPRIP